MSRICLLPLVLVCATGCDDAPKSRTLLILHTTDEHSHVLGFGPEADEWPTPTTAGTGGIKGGVARRAVLLKAERDAAEAAGYDTITVSAGDNAMGTLMQVPFTAAAPDFTLLKALGYDLTTLGNHEFDFGPKALAQAITAANNNGGMPHIVATNIQFSATDPGDDELAALMDETGSDASKVLHRTWILTTKSGLKVGFIGALGALASTYAPLKSPVTVSLPDGVAENELDKVRVKLFADLQAAADKLRTTDKVDVVILLSHSGVDDVDMTRGEDYMIAQNVSGIDAIVSGHAHLEYPAMTVNNKQTGKPVLIQEAHSYGQLIGKMVLKVDPEGQVTFDLENSTFVVVDDKTVPADPAINMLVENTVKSLEADKVFMGKSYLEQTLSRIEGMTVTDDPATVGDLFFRPIGTTAFEIDAFALYKETPMNRLVADSELFYARAVAGPTDVSLTVTGEVRSSLYPGKVGKIGFSDVYRILPLGIGADGTIGYPLTRSALPAVMLKAALELTTDYAYRDATYYMTTGGLRVEYDTTRTPAADCTPQPACQLDPSVGRITKMVLLTNPADPDDAATGTVIFDRSDPMGPWLNGVDPLATRYVVATSYYIASYAEVNGVTLFDAEDKATAISPEQAIMKYSDGSEVKGWEALGSYIKSFPNGAIPARYGETAPKRMICTGPLCR